MKLSFGSLFSGVGGFDLGFFRNDWECKWMVEFEKNAAGVLAHHYPDVPLHCDVEKVDADQLEVPDVVLAGFPCQDVSQAGLRKGLHEGTRSNLFFHAVGIVQRLRARGNLRYALFENVPGLFSVDSGDGFARCIRELLSIGCSDVGWTVLDAKDVGWCTSDGRRVRSVPQRRRRIFICASFGDTGEATAREIFSFSSRMSRDSQTRGEEGEGTSASFTEGAGAGGGEGVINVPETDVVGALSDGAHMGGGLNGQDAYTGRILAQVTQGVDEGKAGPCYEHHGQDSRVKDCGEISPTIHSKMDNTSDVPIIHAQGVDVYNGQVTGEVAASVTAASGISNATGPKVMEGEAKAFGIQSKVIGRKDKNSPNGSGINEELSFTLDSTDKHAVCSWNGDITPKSAEAVRVTLRAQQGGEGTGIAMPMVVRRLTPKECCRLMAWEDDRLDVSEVLELDGNLWKPTGKQVEQADGPKYKQAGNGVASNCSEWIARRMRHVLEG